MGFCFGNAFKEGHCSPTPLIRTPPNEHKTRSVKAAPGYEGYASKDTSFTSSEDPSPEGKHDSTRLKPEEQCSREVNKTKERKVLQTREKCKRTQRNGGKAFDDGGERKKRKKFRFKNKTI